MVLGNKRYKKVTMNMDKEDHDWLTRVHPASGPAVVIRALVSAYRIAVENKSTLLLSEVENLQ